MNKLNKTQPTLLQWAINQKASWDIGGSAYATGLPQQTVQEAGRLG